MSSQRSKKKHKTFFCYLWFVLQTIFTYRIRRSFVLIWGSVLLSQSLYGQTVLRGLITDKSKLPIAYASVSVKNTIDGATADSLGKFLLTTTAKGSQTIQVSALGFKPLQYQVNMDTISGFLHLTLKKSPGQLNEVVISAGNMDATNDRVFTHIKPVDLLSNASSQGDIVGALQNLPGVQRNGGDETGLFVRGGDATETMVLIDGITVQNPFFSNVPGIGQRSRFNPFQLKGTSFSTGGYSAKFGQALSSVLDLQTSDVPDKTNISIGINLAGIMLTGVQRIGNNALEYAGNYTHNGPFYSLSKNNYDFYSPPQSTAISSRWISKLDKGLFKISMAYNTGKSGTVIPNPGDVSSTIRFNLFNENKLINAAYNYWLSDQVKLFAAVGFSTNNDRILWSDTTFTRNDDRDQARADITWLPADAFKMTVGTEVQHFNYKQQFGARKGAFGETLTAVYLESEYKPISWFAIKPGIRTEYSKLLGRGNMAPRLSLATKTSPSSQLGLAVGIFYQSAAPLYLLQGYKPAFQQAVHYILNYEWIKNNRSFRIETYYKAYNKLIREHNVAFTPNPYRNNLGRVNNSGYGYAKGFDFFWRDKSSIKNFDYWITYSLVDTRRLYQNYLSKVTPDFISKHNLNLILRYAPEKIHTVFSMGYNYASGRPYYNPQSGLFFNDRAPAYQNLSFKVSYLTTIKKVFSAFYFNIDNLTNYKNILGYRYSTDGLQRSPIVPPQYRAVFFGVYLSISEFKKDEL
uniref:TonB-dependent receptor n=1 Tax=Pedobacter schmidteae TaxID=2201271 RepID=UPI000EB3506E|nr:TonB-dependent receptor [Pedobacter schmidteae]